MRWMVQGPIRGLAFTSVMALAACEMATTVPDSNPDAAQPDEAAEAAPARGFLAALRGGAARTSDKGAGGSKDLPPPLAKAGLAGERVVVAGPEGYCVDPVSLQRGPGRGFAVIASCRVLSDGKVGASVPPVIVTVTVGPRGSDTDVPAPETLASVAGVPLISGARGDGLSLAHLGAGGDTTLPDGDARYWRGAFAQGGRLVGLALYAPEGNALAGARGGSLLQDVRRRIRAESAPSPDRPSVTNATAANAALATETAPDAGNQRRAGLLSRLFDR